MFSIERYPHGIFAAGGAIVPTQEKKKKIRKICEMLWTWWPVPSGSLKRQIWTVVPKNLEKSAIKHSIEKPMLLNSMNLSAIFCRSSCIEGFDKDHFLQKVIKILKLYIIFCIQYVLIIFLVYQITHTSSNKCKPLPTKFRKCFW